MKIGLNLLQARPAIGGGWRYIASIVETLARFDTENEYIAYCNSSSKSLVPIGSRIAIEEAGFADTNQFLRLAYENTWLQRRAKSGKLDVLHWFGNTQSLLSVIPSVVTIHDLRSFLGLKEYNPARMLHARVMIPWTVKHARFLLPVSKYTASALQDRFHVPEDRMATIPYPLGDEWQRSGTETVCEFRAKYRLPHKFWLYVAHAYPHKNHRTLFAAYSRLRAEDRSTWPLVLRGDDRGSVDLDKLAAEHDISGSLIRLPQLPSEEMPALYSAATAFVFPSLFEGLGMPLIEALACGCPSVASAIPTTVKLAGDRVLTHDANDANSISTAMKSFQHNDGLRTAYAERCIGFRQEFNPQAVLRALLKCYSASAQPHVRPAVRRSYPKPATGLINTSETALPVMGPDSKARSPGSASR